MKTAKQSIINTAFVTLGILSAGFGLKGFLLSSRFIDGGVTGVSMLIAALSPVPVWVPILPLNRQWAGVGQMLLMLFGAWVLYWCSYRPLTWIERSIAHAHAINCV